jgi:hypothetical protein
MYLPLQFHAFLTIIKLATALLLLQLLKCASQEKAVVQLASRLSTSLLVSLESTIHDTGNGGYPVSKLSEVFLCFLQATVGGIGGNARVLKLLSNLLVVDEEQHLDHKCSFWI